MKHIINLIILLGALCTFSQKSGVAQNLVPSGNTAIGSLTITVSNAEGWGNAAQFGRVELFDETNHLVSMAYTAQSQVTFTNLIAGNQYSYKVWYNRAPSKPSGEEFWGGKTGIIIISGQTVDEAFVRNLPYIPELTVYDAITNTPVVGQIIAGRAIRVAVTVRNPGNPGAISGSFRSRLVLDREMETPFDYSDSSQYQSLNAGNDRVDSYTFTPPSAGTYRYVCGVVMDQSGTPITCDGSDWSTLLVVADKFEDIRDINTIALYHFNEANGTWIIDASGRGIHAPATGTAIVAGRWGKAREFNGAGEYVDLPEDSTLRDPGNKLTVDAWILLHAYPAPGEGNHIVSTGNQNDYDFSVGGDGRLNAALFLSSGPGTMYGVNVVPLNAWTHVALTYDGSIVHFFINGVEDARFSRSGTVGGSPQAENLAIGAYYGNNTFSQFFNGIIEELRISNNARLPEDFNLQLPPRNLLASPGAGKINLAWQNGGGALGLLRYRIYRGTDSTNVNVLDSTRSLNYADNSASSGLRLYYRIGAVDSSGFESVRSIASSATATPGLPSIVAIAPIVAKPGAALTVAGSGFGSTPSENIVLVGGVRGVVTSATPTSLTVTVPPGAGFGPVTVTTGGLTAYSLKPFVPTFDGQGGITTQSYSGHVDFATPNKARWGVVADLDGDGKPDIIEPNDNGSLLVLRNTTVPGVINASSFVKFDFPTGPRPYSVGTGDFDGDGKLDVAICNNSGSSTTVLRNTGSPGNLSFTRQDYSCTGVPSGIAVGDLDGDGKPDIYVLGATTSIFRNTSTLGNISFAAPIGLSTGGAHCAIADVDGDGKPDLLANKRTGGDASGFLAVYRNISTPGTLAFAGNVDFPSGNFPHGIAVGDLDGDSKLDVAITVGVGGGSSQYIALLRNTSTPGSVSFAQRVDIPTPGAGWSVKFADIDGDQKLDMGIPVDATHMAALYRNMSSVGSIAFAARVDIPTGTIPYNILFGDFDLDGRPDMETVTLYMTTGVSVHRNLIGSSVVTVPPWSFTNTGLTHTIIIPASANPSINGTPLVAGDYVGVFCDSSGTFACAGYERWTGTGGIAVTAFGDDQTSTPKDGFATGETFRWKIFRAADGVVYDAAAMYAPAGGVITNTNTFAANGISQLSSLVGGSVTHTLNLRSGWGMISSYVEPFAPLLDSVFRPVLADVIIVKNGAGKSFIPSALVNTIGAWSRTEGYQLKMNAPRSLPVRGLRLLPSDNPANLPAGWSIMPYLRDAELPIATALNSIAADIIIVKDQDGKTYIPSIGINSIGNLNVGQGYQIKLTTARTLTYPNRGGGSPEIAAAEKRTTVATTVPSWYFANTGSSHTIVIPQNAALTLDGAALTTEDCIGVFYDSTGTLACAGYQAWTGTSSIAIPAFGDDPTTTSKDGFVVGESLKWKVWRHGDGAVCRVTPGYASVGGMGGIVSDTGAYNTNGISGLVSLSGSTTGVAAGDMPVYYSLRQNYPNPFNPATMIPIALPLRSHVSLAVYNALGELVARVVNGEMEAGYHNIMFEAYDLPSGIYFYRLQAGSFVETKKMAVVR